MRVVARKIDSLSCPPNVRSYLGQSFVTVGKRYLVYAIASFQSVLLAQVVDDAGYPSWRPFWLFDVVERSIPKDWICAVFHEEPSLVLGPAFVAESLENYVAMVELEPSQVSRFWNYVKLHGSQGADE